MRRSMFSNNRRPISSYRKPIVPDIPVVENIPSENEVRQQVDKIKFITVDKSKPTEHFDSVVGRGHSVDRESDNDDELPGEKLKEKLLKKLSKEKNREEKEKHNLSYLFPKLKKALKETMEKPCGIKFKDFKLKYQLEIKHGFDNIESDPKSVNSFCHMVAAIMCKVISKKVGDLDNGFESKYSEKLFNILI